MNPKLIPGLVTSLLVFAACTSSSESANRDQMTAMVGIYEPPGPGVVRVRAGVPAFQKSDKLTGDMAEVAADQLVSLMVNTERFDVVERNQLEALLKEQGLEGIVRSGELAQPAQVRGIDLMLLGKVTNFRVKAEKTSKGFNLGSIPIPGTRGALGLFDINDKNSKIQVDVGVDLRLVDPTTGRPILMAPRRQQRPMHTGPQASGKVCPFCQDQEAEPPHRLHVALHHQPHPAR
jgi:curli biogenesis system outer membrane secretion channel CsgG